MKLAKTIFSLFLVIAVSATVFSDNLSVEITSPQRNARFENCADIQIAATAIGHNLELITGNLRHFNRISDVKLNNILANS